METLFDFAKSSYLRVRVVESTRASQRQTLQSDISRAVFVCTCRMAARLTNKAVSRLSVCLLRVTAVRTPLAGMARVDPQERNPGASALVVKELPNCAALSYRASWP